MICNHFKIHELVPPQVFKNYGDRAWEFLDSRLLVTIDILRDKFGPMTINNYVFGGDRQWSGLRTPDSPFYTPGSQHTFGRAVDCLFNDISVSQVRSEIINNSDKYPHIRGIENGVPWLHIDVRNCDQLKIFDK